jgi:hypothetical protein
MLISLIAASLFLSVTVRNILGQLLVVRPVAKQRIAQLKMLIAELEQQARQIQSAPLSESE